MKVTSSRLRNNLNLPKANSYLKSILSCSLLLLLTFQVSAQYYLTTSQEISSEVNTKNPSLMIEQITRHTFTRLQNESVQIRKNPNLLKEIIKKEISPYFNHRYAAAKVLGKKHFKNATKEQFNAFSSTFREFVITSYAQIFTLYTDQTVKYQPSKQYKDRKIISVSLEIISNSRPPVDISFKLRVNKKTKEWQVFDLVAEGISFLDSKRSELNKLLNEKGIEFTNDILIEKSLSDIRFNKVKA